VVRGRLKPEGDRPVLDGHADLLEDRVHVLTHVCAGRRRLVRVQQVRDPTEVAVRCSDLRYLSAALLLDPSNERPKASQSRVSLFARHRSNVCPSSPSAAITQSQCQPVGIQCHAVPGAVHQEVLELLQGGRGQDLSHPFSILAGQLRQQAQEIVGAVLGPSLPREHQP
jgi:hypothetical protein